MSMNQGYTSERYPLRTGLRALAVTSLLLCGLVPEGAAAPTTRLYTVAFGTQALTAPLRVSDSVPLVSRMVTLPAVSCPSCSDASATYTYDEVWEVDRGVLDTGLSQAVSGAGARQRSWVFQSRAIGESSGIAVMIRQQDPTQGRDCEVVTGGPGEYQCRSIGKNGSETPAVPVEVGLMVVNASVTPGGLATLNRPFLTRVVTFRQGDRVMAEYRDAITVSASTTMASCNVSAGALVFNLPARSLIAGGPASVSSRITTAPPADSVERTLNLSCVGNTRLDIRFTPLTGTLDSDRILQAQSAQGTPGRMGFQLWYRSSEWPGGDSAWRLAQWDGASETSLLSGTPLLRPRPADAPDIALKFRAGYAWPADTAVSAADAGPVTARGLYTLSYQ
ncbi:hypothetical protein HF675_03485 [Serratia sp. JUb9]|uniref:hypothetical protein n=1 Tax=unclassified Serratia (in: enterobacteria) TaxID=2647522 RepID=UPI001319F18E|nr:MULTISPECIES: hypothetical protein [unclassified Serratia (in: enterobacteria)]MCA4824790.1 hypothetical protein [Serratia rubidaea]QNK33142.1 hypothetical protein HF675_03485 [Serratia sp. JUb9]